MIDKQFIGYEVPPTLWDVEKGRIRFFAEVIGATDPIYFDASAAQAAGYRNVVAPPTFISVSYTHLTLPTNREV